MKNITLGRTGIVVPQNGFGALPVQRDDMKTSITILRRAYEGGMRFFDTARAYSDSEEKLGNAFEGIRDKIYIATKTMATTPEKFWEDLNTSLELLKTDYIDLYQFHCAGQVFRPNDGTGMYECMLQAKEEGKIRHIGITAHKLQIALDAVETDLYETMQFPFSYLSSKKELELVQKCANHNVGFVAMKGLAGGLINNSRAAMAYMTQFDNVLPIWGVQRMQELEEWLGFFDNTPIMDAELTEFIEKEKKELSGDFCRGCGYCMPCPAGITINQCARMSLMLRRAPSEAWLSDYWQAEMQKISSCLKCGKCKKKCPYELDTPNLLIKNYEDYKRILAGEVSVK